MAGNTRRTHSMSGPLYWALRAWCRDQDPPVPMAGVIDDLVTAHLEREGAPVHAKRPASVDHSPHSNAQPSGPACFTF